MTKHVFQNNSIYFLTSRTNNGEKYFDSDLAKELILLEIKNAKKKYIFELYAWVIMPNHIHLLIKPIDLKVDCVKDSEAEIFDLYDERNLSIISKIMNQIKGGSARRINKTLFEQINQPSDLKVRRAKIWKEGYFSEIIRDDKMFWQKVNYIHKNPVKHNMVQNPENYRYSSYGDYVKKYGEGFMMDNGKPFGITI